FRGLIFGSLLATWGRNGLVRAAALSSFFFAVIHALNVLAGDQVLRVGAQVLWAFVLGVALAFLARSGASVWPVAMLQGARGAIVHTTRMGVRSELPPARAAVMVLASLPGLLYAAAQARRALRGGEG